MLKMRWLPGLALVASITLPACTTKTSLGREGEDGDVGRDTQSAPRCTYGTTQLDVSCNEDRNLSLSAGICGPDGTCSCRSGFVLNPTSNRCRLSVDAEVVTCIVGDDTTCYDTKSAGGSGTCLEKGCACNTGFVINPATGRCRPAPATDAGAKTDSVAGNVCTFLLDQTCNDDDSFSGLAGVCAKGGTCSCSSGFVINSATGRCRAGATPDAAAILDAWVEKDTGTVVVDAPARKDLGKDTPGVCTFGMNQTCNDEPWASWVAGTCQSNGTCVCGTGYVMNASSGRCAYLPKDAGTDSKSVCTPGMDQTCNDSPAVSALWGVCQANGTCTCNTGYVINPSTGKCMYPEAGTCSGSFRACGCGCCGEPPIPLCYYPSAGETVNAIKAADDTAKDDPNCVRMGCGLGQLYLCCAETAAEPASSAQYSAVYHVGGLDRISLDKTGNDGNCMSLVLATPVPTGTSETPLSVSLPTRWGIEGPISARACDASTSTELSIGAQGTITFTPNGTSCAISAHVTVFFYAAASGTVTTRRLDADNIAITGGAPSGYCK